MCSQKKSETYILVLVIMHLYIDQYIIYIRFHKKIETYILVLVIMHLYIDQYIFVFIKNGSLTTPNRLLKNHPKMLKTDWKYCSFCWRLAKWHSTTAASLANWIHKISRHAFEAENTVVDSACTRLSLCSKATWRKRQ